MHHTSLCNHRMPAHALYKCVTSAAPWNCPCSLQHHSNKISTWRLFTPEMRLTPLRRRLTSPHAELPLCPGDLCLLGSARQGPLGGPEQALGPLWPSAAEAASWKEGQALQAAGAPAMAGLAGVQQAATAGAGVATALLPPRPPTAMAPTSAAASAHGGAHMMGMLQGQQQQQQVWMQQQQQQQWMQPPGAEPCPAQQQAAPSAAKGFSLVPDLRSIQRSIAEL